MRGAAAAADPESSEMHLHLLVLIMLVLSLMASTAAAAPAVSSTPTDVDCAFRHLAVRVAARDLLGDAAKVRVAAAGLRVANCTGGAGWAAAALAEHEHAAPSHSSAPPPADASIFVSPTGSDSNAGTLAAPLRTLAAAAARVRGSTQRPISVVLRAGTYYESLVLGPADSGASASKRVTWRSYTEKNETAVLSGGSKISCDWKKGAGAAWSCALPAGHPSFTSLFVNGVRAQRARWPNGDPSVPCSSPSRCAAAGYTHASKYVGTHL